MNSPKGKSALVIGGSMAGLLTARILSNHFEKVTIIERDLMHNFPESRKGQPHTAHVHALHAKGLNIITTYFPDLLESMQSAGIPLIDPGESMRWYCYGGYRARFTFGMKAIPTSRPFLEWHIRQRVTALPNVTVKDGYAVEKLLAGDNQQIRGLEIKKQGKNTGSETVMADLVVDSSGRGSRSPKWLEELGYHKPAESTVTCGTGYATRLYARDVSKPGSGDWVFITPQAPRERRAGAAVPVEGDKWLLGLGGWHGDHSPTNEEGFIDFARSLPAPDIYNIITTSTPLSDIVSYKFPASLRRHYEKMDRFPQRYLVLGDAVCSFNPLYGQGMTSAAMQAAALDSLLIAQKNLDDLYKPYFKQIAKIVDIPWQTAVGEDFRYPQTQGKKAPGTDLINSYIDKVHLATHHDPIVGAALFKVLNMMEPPTSLLNPKILWRVLRNKVPKQPVKEMVTA
jgi:2-polyprenyl-6-methoxyphenol hydroxylase-like FAD-dependent oxidoreductase